MKLLFQKRIQSYFILLLLCLGLYLPGLFSLPAIDRDEARFAQASRQMLESRDFVRISFQNQPRHKKPVGIYWLQSAAVAATGTLKTDNIWAYRVPSVLGAILAVFLTFFFGKQLFNNRIALLGAALLASCLLLTVEAHLAKTDAMLLAAATAAQGALALVYINVKNGRPVNIWIIPAFWLAQGIGILLKGPIVPLISGLTAVALCLADRKADWLKQLRPLPGIILVILIASPWMIAINQATGGAFFSDAVGKDLLPKLFSGQESHGAPPGLYLLLMTVTFWPGSIFVWPALVNAWKMRVQWNIRFLIAWIVPFWLMFELIPTKLAHYVLPTYPGLALLTALAVIKVTDGDTTLSRSKTAHAGFVAWCAVAVILSVFVAAVPIYLKSRFDPIFFCPIGIVVITLIYITRQMSRHHLRKIMITSIVSAILFFGSTFEILLPGIDALWLSREAAQAVNRHVDKSSVDPIKITATGYHEPSLVFYCGTDIQLLSPDQAARFLCSFPESIAIVTSDVEAAFKERLIELDTLAYFKEAVHGYNYTKGRWVTLKLFTSSPN